MRIAIPVANNELCLHFGHCQAFALLDLEDQRVKRQQTLNPPAHQPGVLPRWLAGQGVNVVIAGGMGMRAQQLFQQHGIQVIVGAAPSSPIAIAEAFLAGKLETGENVCDH